MRPPSFIFLFLFAGSVAAQHAVPPNGKWSLDLLGGWSHRTAPIEKDMSQQLQDYVRGLVNGWHAEARITRSIGSGAGVGLDVSRAGWSYSDPVISLTDVYGSSGNFSLEDRIAITYAGAGIRLRHGRDEARTHFDTDAGVGIMIYHHETTIDAAQLTLDGFNLGLNIRCGLETRLTPRASLLIDLSYLHARINDLHISDREGARWIVLWDKDLLLHRLDVSAGLRWTL